jgi:hypothetical protein
MITSECTCADCTAYALVEQPEGMHQIGGPRKPNQIPGQFKWKPMLAANQYWTYLVTCKICKWEKFSDFYNVQQWLWVHYEDNCQKPFQRWQR